MWLYGYVAMLLSNLQIFKSSNLQDLKSSITWKQKSWFDLPHFRFMFFDRNEIHIQAFGEIPPAKLMSGDSSSSTFHDFQEFIICNHQNFRSSNLRIFKFRNFKNRKVRYTGLPKISKKWGLRFPKSIFSKDVPWFFLVFFKYFHKKYGEWGSTTGPKNLKF